MKGKDYDELIKSQKNRARSDIINNEQTLWNKTTQLPTYTLQPHSSAKEIKSKTFTGLGGESTLNLKTTFRRSL